jgi:hypothetical protein
MTAFFVCTTPSRRARRRRRSASMRRRTPASCRRRCTCARAARHSCTARFAASLTLLMLWLSCNRQCLRCRLDLAQLHERLNLRCCTLRVLRVCTWLTWMPLAQAPEIAISLISVLGQWDREEAEPPGPPLLRTVRRLHKQLDKLNTRLLTSLSPERPVGGSAGDEGAVASKAEPRGGRALAASASVRRAPSMAALLDTMGSVV